MAISVKKVVAISIVVSLLGVVATWGLRTLPLREIVGPLEAETTYGPIKLMLRLDKNTFTLGEKVNVTVTMTNIINETIQLNYYSLPKTDFAVYNSSSQRIFLFATDGGGWPGILASIVLEPSKSYGQTWKWDQQKSVGGYQELQPVEPGIYYITGRTGPLLYYLGPKDEWREDYEFKGIIAVETPKIGIQIEGSIGSIGSSCNKNAVEAIVHPLKLVMSLNKTEYMLGESVTINLRLTNISNSTVTLGFRNRSPPTWLRFKVYNASDDLVFVSSPFAWPAGTEVSLDLGSFIGQTHEWDQKAGDQRYNNLHQLKSGTYKIIGFLDDLCALNNIINYETPPIQLETPPVQISIG